MTRPDPRERVAYVLRKFPVLSETFILNEILALEKQGVPIHIFALAPPRDPKFHEGVVRLRAPITYVPGMTDLRGLARYVGSAAPRYRGNFWRAMLGVLASGRPRVVWRFLQAAYIAERASRLGVSRFHAHFANRATTVARLASRMTGIPYSFTAHAFDIYSADVSPRVLRRKIDDASVVIAISESNARLLREVAPASADKIRLLRNGVDLSLFTPARTAEPRCFTLVSVARLVEKKGLPYLIEACGRLRDRGLDFRCFIVGRGRQRPQLVEAIRALRLEDRVRLLGAVRQGDVPALYHAADAFVLPAIVASNGNREGLPVSIVEALACGLPVVSTPVSGIGEVVRDGHNGMLVPERDAAALASALERLITDRALHERLCANARPSVRDEFDILHTAQALGRLLRGEAA